jgi:hypothetical protein
MPKVLVTEGHPSAQTSKARETCDRSESPEIAAAECRKLGQRADQTQSSAYRRLPG